MSASAFWANFQGNVVVAVNRESIDINLRIAKIQIHIQVLIIELPNSGFLIE